MTLQRANEIIDIAARDPGAVSKADIITAAIRMRVQCDALREAQEALMEDYAELKAATVRSERALGYVLGPLDTDGPDVVE